MSTNLVGEKGMKKRQTEDTKALAKSAEAAPMDYAALVAAIEQTHPDLSGRCKPSTLR